MADLKYYDIISKTGYHGENPWREWNIKIYILCTHRCDKTQIKDAVEKMFAGTKSEER